MYRYAHDNDESAKGRPRNEAGAAAETVCVCVSTRKWVRSRAGPRRARICYPLGMVRGKTRSVGTVFWRAGTDDDE